jgi:alcohol dehydrogenase class IV
MSKFEFFGVPPVYFGNGQSDRLGELAGRLGKTALLLHAGSPDGPAIALLRDNLAKHVRVVPHRQSGEPKVTDIDAGLNAARHGGCDMVIGLGGGSAIDAAKAVAGLLTNGGAALDYMEVIGRGQKITKPAAPWIAVPTTAGTGAEVTRNAVIGDPEKRFKASIRSEHLLPRAVVVDPVLGIDVPPTVTAYSGMDALCQCIESYTSNGANPITDALAIQGATLAAKSLRRAFADGSDLSARQDMAMAALLSGITLTNAGLGAVHGFAAPLGANFPAPHGAVCAILLTPVIEANLKELRTLPRDSAGLDRYATLGRNVTGRFDMSQTDACTALRDLTCDLVRDLRIPPLSQFGMATADIPEIVALARKSSSMKFNPVPLSDEVLAEVLERGIRG